MADNPLELWVKIAASKSEFYDPDHPTHMELVLGVSTVEIDEEHLRSPRGTWGLKVFEDPLTAVTIKMVLFPYTYVESAQDEGDLLAFRILNRLPCKYLVDSNVPRLLKFYMGDRPGFTPAEKVALGLTTPLFGPEDPLPIAFMGKSETSNLKTATRTATLNWRARMPNPKP